MYLVKTPKIVQRLFPRMVWCLPCDVPTLYLTFDDGPIPEVTPWVLNVLAQYGAKATFFCVGENVDKYPHIYEQVKKAGHALGNHTYNHLNGWVTNESDYLLNVQQCAKRVSSNLFRPPYGRLRLGQANRIHHEYEIIMWDVLSGDFDAQLKPEDCFENVIKYTQNGSIIVFHDSIKASKNLMFALPKVLAHFHANGYRFEVIPEGRNRATLH